MFIKGAVFGSVTAISLWALNIFANSSDIFTPLEAAEVIEPSDNGDKSKKGPSRRARFNFVAEVVAETGASLVYIKIKDRKVFKISKRLQVFIWNVWKTNNMKLIISLFISFICAILADFGCFVFFFI